MIGQNATGSGPGTAGIAALGTPLGKFVPNGNFSNGLGAFHPTTRGLGIIPGQDSGFEKFTPPPVETFARSPNIAFSNQDEITPFQRAIRQSRIEDLDTNPLSKFQALREAEAAERRKFSGFERGIIDDFGLDVTTPQLQRKRAEIRSRQRVMRPGTFSINARARRQFNDGGVVPGTGGEDPQEALIIDTMMALDPSVNMEQEDRDRVIEMFISQFGEEELQRLAQRVSEQGDGQSDSVPGTIDGQEPVALSKGEFVVPSDVVSGLGNGDTESGARQLMELVDKIRRSRTGSTAQPAPVNPKQEIGGLASAAGMQGG